MISFQVLEHLHPANVSQSFGYPMALVDELGDSLFEHQTTNDQIFRVRVPGVLPESGARAGLLPRDGMSGRASTLSSFSGTAPNFVGPSVPITTV